MTRSFSNRIFRFAPSSNGYLHLGHAYSALLNFTLAQAVEGRLLLRIEDIDLERCRPAYEQAIYEDLSWLGLVWETPVRRQSDHFADYAAALARLSSLGLIYPCFCSRRDILEAVSGRPGWPQDPDGSPLYPGNCRALSAAARERRLSAGEPASLRIDMEAALAHIGRPLEWCEFASDSQSRRIVAQPALWGDVTLSRKDIGASYHIAVVVDDALQDVTDVVRGEDLFMATGLHRLLQILLDLPEPSYRHHALLRNATGQKLSKSARAKPIRALREEGWLPGELKKRLSSESVFVASA